MRIRIENSLARASLFCEIKELAGNSWKGVQIKFGIPRKTLDQYRSGGLTLPEELFLRFISFLEESKKREIILNSERLPDNFGQIKGGERAYIINKSKFEEGRKKGMRVMTKMPDKPISFSLDLTLQICEFAGTFIGDGCFNLYKNKLYQVEFAGDSRYDSDYYQKVIIPAITNVVPDVRPHVYKSKTGNSQRVVFYSKKLFIFFRDFLGFIPGKKSYTVAIPEKILKAGDEYVRATIRGIFDTDGGVFLDKRKQYILPYPRIILQTVSKPLYDQLSSYLSPLFSLYKSFNQKRQVYIIEIYGIQQVKRWMSLIGFSNQRHLKKIASVAQW